MRDRRLLINRHNGFLGSAHMMRSQCRSIIESQTATDEAKQSAQAILSRIPELIEHLKKRKPFPPENP